MFTWAVSGENFTIQAQGQLYPLPKWCPPHPHLPLTRPRLSTHSHPVDYTADYEPSCCRQPIVSTPWTKTTLPWRRRFRTFWPQGCYQLLGQFRSGRHDVTSLIYWCQGFRKRRAGGLPLSGIMISGIRQKNVYDTGGTAPGNAKNNTASQIAKRTAGLSIW